MVHKKQYLDNTPINNVENKIPRYFVAIEDIYLSTHVTSVLSSDKHGLSNTEILKFRKCCLNFLIKGCSQMFQRFSFKSKSCKILKQLFVISPDSVMSNKTISTAPLASNFSFGRSHLEEIDREWHILRNYDFKEFYNVETTDVLWTKISKLKLGDDQLLCPNLYAFIISILSLPHSSATVERIFSQINLSKTKKKKQTIYRHTLWYFTH